MKSYNLKIKILLLMLFTVTVLGNNGILQYFTAESNGDSVTVKWSTSSEDDIKRFELERSISTSAFKRIFVQTAKGSPNSYSYNDTEAFMKQDEEPDSDFQSQKTYSYRIKIYYNDNSFTYSDATLVKHKPSSIRRTWGMIKEMFR